MDKKRLNEYIDACELVKETEKDIDRLRKKKKAVVTGSVKGSMNDFPYAETHFKVEGAKYTYSDDLRLRAEEKLLEERIAQAERIKAEVDDWMNGIPLRMQRIIRYRFFEDLSWEKVAAKIGKNCTGEGIRKEYERFMRSK